MATGDDIQMPWGSWGIGVSRERRKDGIWFKVRLCLYRRSHFLGRFEDPFIARLAYDAAISQLRPGSRTNYDRRFFELTDAAALDKVQVFVLKTEQQYGKSKYAKHAGQGLPGSPMEEEADTLEEEEPADSAGQLLHRSSSGLTGLTSMLNSAQQQLQQDPEQLMTAASFMQMLDSMPAAQPQQQQQQQQQPQLSPPPPQQQQQLDALLPAFLGPAATRHISPGSPGQSVMAAAAAAGMHDSTSSIPYPYTHPEPLAAFQRGNGANNAGAAGSYGYYEPMPLADPGWAAPHSIDVQAAAAAAPMYAAAECGYAPNVHMAFDRSYSSSPSNSSSSNGGRGLLAAAGRPAMAAGRLDEAARCLQGVGHTASPFAVAPHHLAALQQQHALARPAAIEPYPPAAVGMPPAAGTSAHSSEAFYTTQQQQQQQLGVCMASPMTDAEWDLILQQLSLPMYIQEQQQQQHLMQQQQQHLMQQQQLFSSAHMVAGTQPLAAPYHAAAAAAAAAPMHAAAAVAGRGSRGSPPQLIGPSSAAAAAAVAAAAPMLAAAAAGSRVMPSIAGTSTPSDVLCFIRVSVAQLLQLNASLMLHSGNSCAFGEVCAWMSQARLALEADPGTDSRGQQQGSKGAVELLRQLMMVFSQSIGAGGSGSSSGTYGAGVLAARPAVKALVDSLLAALASLGQLLAACGAAPCSSISEEVVAGWLAGLQQLAARGSAADVSVLQLCSALAAEPYAGL